MNEMPGWPCRPLLAVPQTMSARTSARSWSSLPVALIASMTKRASVSATRAPISLTGLINPVVVS
jgi:hypothetical protein